MAVEKIGFPFACHLTPAQRIKQRAERDRQREEERARRKREKLAARTAPAPAAEPAAYSLADFLEAHGDTLTTGQIERLLEQAATGYAATPNMDATPGLKSAVSVPLEDRQRNPGKGDIAYVVTISLLRALPGLDFERARRVVAEAEPARVSEYAIVSGTIPVPHTADQSELESKVLDLVRQYPGTALNVAAVRRYFPELNA